MEVQMVRYASLIAANTFHNRRRSALTVASIAVSLCLLAVLDAAYLALFEEPEASPAEALRLMTHHKISITQPMPVSFEARIRQIPGVADAMVWQWFGGTYKDARDPRNFFARFAVEPARLFGIRSELRIPAGHRARFQQERTGCIAGRKLAARFAWKPGDRVTLLGDIFPVTLELTIVGIYNDPNNDEILYFNYEYLRELLKAEDAGSDQVGVFIVQVKSLDAVIPVADAIDKEFENSTAPTETVTERAWQLSFLSFLGNLKLFLSSICGALGFTVLLVCANTISMAVRERIREVGILKTLGFRPGTLVALTIAESTCLALAGGAIGLGLAEILCVMVQSSGTAYAALNLRITAEVALASCAAAVALGVGSSALPAWQASRMNILDALRHTG
jgi:putative ABC transport system permease protein